MKDTDREGTRNAPAPSEKSTITVELTADEARGLINAANLLIDTLAAISEGNGMYSLVTATMKLETAVLIAEGE